MKSTQMATAVLGATVLAALLSGCGAGAADGAEDRPPVDTGLYQQMASYCQATPPGPGEPVRDGWVMSSGYTGNGSSTFESNAIVSANGSSAEGLGPVTLKVGIHDYRGLASGAQIVPSGYANPNWVMGAALSGTMRAKSVACVVQLAKIRPSSTGMGLYWRSFWNEAVPMAQLSGYQIDGFEFVGNFTPADGQAWFALDKQRYPAPQTLSVCYLAPGAGAWKCSQPELSDQGATWQLRVRGLAPGVYVLNASTPRG